MLSAVAATASLSAGLELLDLQSVPAWMQKDVHITHGYRSQTNSFRRCCHSLWYLHNESVNIWSHLLTGFCFLALLAGSIALPPSLWWPFDFASGGSNDLWALRVYLLGTTVCLFFSVCIFLPDLSLFLLPFVALPYSPQFSSLPVPRFDLRSYPTTF